MTLSGAGFVYRKSSLFREGCRILAYHGVMADPNDSYAVSNDHFKSHMAFLSDNFRILDLAKLAQDLKAGAKPEENCIAVTFDDGYKECGNYVAETLDRYEIPATFFVVTDIIDGKTKISDREFLSWRDVKAMADAGLSFGSHTAGHRSLGILSPDEVMRELTDSGRRIQEEIGTFPAGLAYPYGTIRDFSVDIARAAENAGYAYAATAVNGLNYVGGHPYMLRRTTLTAGDGLHTFRMIVNGCLDPWRAVDLWATRLQRPTSGGLGL